TVCGGVRGRWAERGANGKQPPRRHQREFLEHRWPPLNCSRRPASVADASLPPGKQLATAEPVPAILGPADCLHSLDASAVSALKATPALPHMSLRTGPFSTSSRALARETATIP